MAIENRTDDPRIPSMTVGDLIAELQKYDLATWVAVVGGPLNCVVKVKDRPYLCLCYETWQSALERIDADT